MSTLRPHELQTRPRPSTFWEDLAVVCGLAAAYILSRLL